MIRPDHHPQETEAGGTGTDLPPDQGPVGTAVLIGTTTTIVTAAEAQMEEEQEPEEEEGAGVEAKAHAGITEAETEASNTGEITGIRDMMGVGTGTTTVTRKRPTSM